MTRCSSCGSEPADETACSQSTVVLCGLHLFRIRFGEERPRVALAERCPACGTPRGAYHHLGCRVEQCPHCLARLKGCKCRRAAGPNAEHGAKADGERSEMVAAANATLESLVILEQKRPSSRRPAPAGGVSTEHSATAPGPAPRILPFRWPFSLAGDRPPEARESGLATAWRQFLILLTLAVITAGSIWLYNLAQERAVNGASPAPAGAPLPTDGRATHPAGSLLDG